MLKGWPWLHGAFPYMFRLLTCFSWDFGRLGFMTYDPLRFNDVLSVGVYFPVSVDCSRDNNLFLTLQRYPSKKMTWILEHKFHLSTFLGVQIKFQGTSKCWLHGFYKLVFVQGYVFTSMINHHVSPPFAEYFLIFSNHQTSNLLNSWNENNDWSKLSCGETSTIFSGETPWKHLYQHHLRGANMTLRGG